MTTLGALWDVTRMRLLVEIDRRGSLSAAAAAVGIGQPSASQHLRLLEAAAGQRLVERNGRGSRLTPGGRILARRAAQALATLGAAEEELDALAGLQTGTIHLGASTVPGVYLLPDTLGCFRRDFPNVKIEVEIASTGEIVRRLLDGRVQLALVGAAGVGGARLAFEPFLDDEIVGIARPGAIRTRSGLADEGALAEHTLLARERESAQRRLVDDVLARAGVRPGSVWELGSSEAIKRAAREGLGFSFLSRYAVAEEVERGALESFRLDGHPIERQLFVARLAGRPLSPAERGFVETLTRCCAKSASYAAACVA